MVKITSFMICNTIEKTTGVDPESGAPILVSPQVSVRPEFIPSNFSFGVAAGITNIDPSSDSRVKITIENPDGEIIFESDTVDLPKASNTDKKMPINYQGYMLTLDIRNLQIKKEGCYKFKVFIDDSLIDTKDIPIYEGQK